MIDSIPVENKNPLDVKVPEIQKTPSEISSEKLVESLKDFPFLKYANGVLNVQHAECKEVLEIKKLKMGDLSKRGTILTNLNGGATNPDDQTAYLNGCLATVQVGFRDIKLDLLNVEDSSLILGLYTAIVKYNEFFRATPLGFIL